jgi:hypothetical protein
MGGTLSDDMRKQYQKAFQTIREIVVAFPEDRWKARHGDGYYVPCRLAYHLALCTKYHLLGGYKDKEYYTILPYGRWNETKAEDLPGKVELLAFLDGIFSRATQALELLTDAELAKPAEPERAWAGETTLGLHLYMMRELSAHTGELNTMLVQDGAEDIIWIR